MVRRTNADRARRAALADAAAGMHPSEAGAGADRPQMTLRVYRVTATGERSAARTTEYRPDTTEPPAPGKCWPECKCRRCKRKNGQQR